jgi:ATP-dependent Clp protease ATP-binding subunit ClpA
MKEKLIDLSFDEKTCLYLAKKCDGSKRGARELRNIIRREIENKIVDLVISLGEGTISNISITADNEIVITC